MPWFAWVMVALYALSIVAQWVLIGQKREPITVEGAMLSTITALLLIWGVVELAV
jgi:hypothetical protein